MGEVLAQLDTQILLTQQQEFWAQQDQLQAQLQELPAGPRLEIIAVAQATVPDLQE
jgi:hypothetical protein